MELIFNKYDFFLLGWMDLFYNCFFSSIIPMAFKMLLTGTLKNAETFYRKAFIQTASRIKVTVKKVAKNRQ